MKLDSDNATLLAINGRIPGTQNTTIEVFQADKWTQSSIVIPALIGLFCVAFRDSKTILISGGVQSDTYNIKTYLLDLETMTWSEGPKFNLPSSYCQCGRLITSREPVIEYNTFL